jgi:antitoxin component YwqK of YwqJK toxin-antitoxin module
METLFSKEKYLVILQIIEEDYSFNLRKAKEFYEAGDFEALHRIVVCNQTWLLDQGIIKDPLSGIGETWYPNGQLRSRGTYVDGEENGVWEFFHSNGKFSTRGTYVDGEENGVWEFFHENGQPYTCGTYVNGKRHGAWEWFDDNGRIYMRGSYVYGEFSPIPL